MKKTIIKIQKMDCPSEIKLIEGLVEKIDSNIKVAFDLSKREATFYHETEKDIIQDGLKNISLPGIVLGSEKILEGDTPDVGPSVEKMTLIYLLIINFIMFVVEFSIGIYAESTGLLADGLDMLADSFVYGISLYAVGKSLKEKNRAASLSGKMQIALGLICLIEVARKVYFGSEPLSSYMITISLIALFANIWCLRLIYKHKDGEVHMKASWIFSANDVIVNSGVLLSGGLVYLLKSNIPDLIIGAIVSTIVVKGGITILKISKNTLGTPKVQPCCSNK